MRIGLIAAGLVLLSAAVLLTGGGRAESSTVRHTCSATDRQFIARTRLDMASLGIWASDYRSGTASEQEVINEAQRATNRVNALSPRDPSLHQTKLLLAGMLTEYARAMRAKLKEKDAAPHVYKAFTYANAANEILENAAPELRRVGCDVTPLL